jgi:CRP-like cAMP-binding protein
LTITSVFAARMNAAGPFDGDDLRALLDLPMVTFTAPAQSLIAREGDPLEAATILLQGLACRTKLRPNGVRQILSVHLPGDPLDTQPSFEQRDDGLEALTLCRGVQIQRTALHQLMNARPGLAAAFARVAAVDANITAERLLSLGRRAAIQRLAHFFCELTHRMDAVGLGTRGRYDLPLTQAELGDALGLSVVHVNRTLQQLRATGAISFRSQRLVVHDADKLCAIAEFSPGYLHLPDRRPALREPAVA